jgi:2-amino-4-hydroxy-6-hydroxymethyldihydropteridine diphosphokinase
VTRAYLSLGSNLEPEKHLRAAIDELWAKFGAVNVSPTYRFPAVGFEGPDFLNLVAVIDTDLDPIALNDWLHDLENRHGRRRDMPRFSSRTLDIDIVLYGDDVIAGSNHLQIPRDELKHAFVLQPMADIAGDVIHPISKRSIAELWRDSNDVPGKEIDL